MIGSIYDIVLHLKATGLDITNYKNNIFLRNNRNDYEKN